MLFRILATRGGVTVREEFCRREIGMRDWSARKIADDLCAAVIQELPDCEVLMWEGAVLLMSVGPRTCADFSMICEPGRAA